MNKGVNNKIEELQNAIGINKFNNLIKDKVEWLFFIGVQLFLVTGKEASKFEHIIPGGKVVWEKDRIPKKPLQLMINLTGFKGISVLASFLHECGHINNKDKKSISFQTQESEISAWQHAANDFILSNPNADERSEFYEIIYHSLSTYEVNPLVVGERFNNILFKTKNRT